MRVSVIKVRISSSRLVKRYQWLDWLARSEANDNLSRCVYWQQRTGGSALILVNLVVHKSERATTRD